MDIIAFSSITSFIFYTGLVLGVNHTNIYNVFFMCLCNLNDRFTPILVKITLIPHLLMFCRIRRKIKQSDVRNQVKRFTAAKLSFVIAKGA